MKYSLRRKHVNARLAELTRPAQFRGGDRRIIGQRIEPLYPERVDRYQWFVEVFTRADGSEFVGLDRELAAIRWDLVRQAG